MDLTNHSPLYSSTIRACQTSLGDCTAEGRTGLRRGCRCSVRRTYVQHDVLRRAWPSRGQTSPRPLFPQAGQPTDVQLAFIPCTTRLRRLPQRLRSRQEVLWQTDAIPACLGPVSVCDEPNQIDVLTLFALVVLECLEACKSSSSRDHFMTQARLVFVKVAVLIYLLVVVFVPVCGIKVNVRSLRRAKQKTYPRSPY
jgi:hypothetical protein